MWDNRIFLNRKDAGIQLGRKLEKEYKDRNVLVLGIPRGGVEIGYYVAKALNGELSVLVAKKLPFPGQEELAFGAITEDGSVYLSPLGQRIDPGTADRIAEKQLEEIHRRIEKYRDGHDLPDMTNRIVLIVDDGIATGSTIVPALKLCRKRKAAKIVVASPVSGKNFVKEIYDLADEIVILEKPEDFYAVGQVYEDFHGMEDEEVMELLETYKKS